MQGMSVLGSGDTAARVRFLESLLDGSRSAEIRLAIANWIVGQYIPVEVLVPRFYEPWRRPIRDAMVFVASRLSSRRLAAKLVEQFELPSGTAAEQRLLHLIAQMPGLQKLGQVIARNRRLRRSLRNELTRLENGINDVGVLEIHQVLELQLGNKLRRHEVEIADEKLSEASVSAVVRFTWRNPQTKSRERGVFKVLKPHIPACFDEDMQILQALSEFFGARHGDYGLAAETIPDTFAKVRELLEHEVDFAAEQATLGKAEKVYQALDSVIVPRLIRTLSTANVTAMTEEAGAKVTASIARTSKRQRRRVAVELIDALVLVPLFSPEQEAIFHCDPHAGNLLYDRRTGSLVLIDWALTESLTIEQRRHLILLFATLALKNRPALCREIEALSQLPHSRRNSQVIEQRADSFLETIPPGKLPELTDAMKLLQSVAVAGVPFPAPLIMFSKVLFTLDGILNDVAGSRAHVGPLLMRRAVRGLIDGRLRFRHLMQPSDWISVSLSAALAAARAGVRIQEDLSRRYLRVAGEAPAV